MKVIAITKLSAPQQRKWLKERGVVPASNIEGRTEQIRDILTKRGVV